MSHFKFLSHDEDIEKILQQILDNEQDWGYVSKLKNIGGDLNPYGFMPMTMAQLTSYSEDPKNAEGLQRTALYTKYKYIKQWLKSWSIRKTARAAFFRLQPGRSVGWHTDHGTYYKGKDRYHLCLQGAYKYWVGDNPLLVSADIPQHPQTEEDKQALLDTAEMHIIEPGTFFWFDNKKYHRALSIGNVERISFVFDVPKSKDNP